MYVHVHMGFNEPSDGSQAANYDRSKKISGSRAERGKSRGKACREAARGKVSDFSLFRPDVGLPPIGHDSSNWK